MRDEAEDPEADRFVPMVEDMVEPPRMMRRLEVITGAGGRRSWSEAEKARILAEAMAPGAVVSAVARRHGMTPQHLFTWRRQAQHGQIDAGAVAPLTFVPALIDAPTEHAPRRLRRSRRCEETAGIVLEVAGVTVRIGAGASEHQITAVIRALKATA